MCKILVHGNVFCLQVDEFLGQLPVGSLPGVGSVLKEKLEKQNIQTCGQLCLISKVKHFVVMDMSGCLWL